MMQLDHPVGDWPASVMKSTAASSWDTPSWDQSGCRGAADLVIFESGNWSEFVARPQSKRTVLVPVDLSTRRLPMLSSELDCLVVEFSI